LRPRGRRGTQATTRINTSAREHYSCTSRFVLIDNVAPRSAANEAALWLSSAEAAGVALGQALAGRLVDDTGIAVALLAAAIPAASAAVLTVTNLSALGTQPAVESRVPR
jgi:predicted MFS family arabinose efflux permease